MNTRDTILAILVPIIFGAGFVVAKHAIATAPPIMIVSLRFLVAGMVLIWFFKLPKNMFRPLLWISLVSAGLQYSMSYSGLKYMDISLAILIVQLEVPVLLFLSTIFFKEKLSWTRAAGIAVAFIGSVIVVASPQLNGAFFGAALVFGGVILWAYGQLKISKIANMTGPAISAWISVLSVPQLLFASFLFESGHSDVLLSSGWPFWAAIIYLGVAMNVIGYSLWYHLIAKYDVSTVSPYLLLIPLTSILGGVVFLHEQMATKTIVGGGFIILGLIIVMFENQIIQTIHKQLGGPSDTG